MQRARTFARKFTSGLQWLLPLCALITLAASSYIIFSYIPEKRELTIAAWKSRIEATANDRSFHLETSIADYLADANTFADYPTAKYLVSGVPPEHEQTSRIDATLHLRALLDNAVQRHGLENAWLFDDRGALVTKATSKAQDADARVLATRLVSGKELRLHHVGEDSASATTYFGAAVMNHARVDGALIIAVRSGAAIIPEAMAKWDVLPTARVRLVEIAEDAAFNESFHEYTDTMGQRGFAAARQIHGSPFGVVVELGRSDALRESNYEIAELLLAVFGLLLALAGVSYALISRQRAAQTLMRAREVERNAVEEALRNTRRERDTWSERARALLEGNVVGVAISTEQGAVLEANDYYLELVGYSRADLERGAIRWVDMTPAEYRSADDNSIRQLHERGQSAPYEKEYIRKDGSRVPVLMADALLHGEDDHVLTFVVDVSAQKTLEQQYQQAQKMEAVGRLAGGVAHDFNNVLTAIKGIASLALDDVQANDPLHADLQEINDCADRATALTRQLLAFSRRQMLQPRIFDVRELLEGTNRMMRRLIGEDIELSVSVPEVPLPVHADPAQIEQVVLNLAVNARDAMPHGGSLRIAAFAVDASDAELELGAGSGARPYVAISVSDTGTGMDVQTMSRIFEPFFTTKEQGKGTGLGLATVYGIVKQSAGAVRVASTPGSGTTFTVYLPFMDVPVPAAVRPPKVDPPHTRKALILVVEDEDAVRALVKRGLQRKGHQVLEARNAGEAMLLAEQYAGRLDLVITDLVMPGLSGTELVKRLRALYPRVDALYMSGYSAEMLQEKGKFDGHFIEKPFTPQQLSSCVAELLSAVVPTGTAR